LPFEVEPFKVVIIFTTGAFLRAGDFRDRWPFLTLRLYANDLDEAAQTNCRDRGKFLETAMKLR
jgi:hypothetical protein